MTSPSSLRSGWRADVLGLTLDNLEGLAFGPILPDGSQSVVVVSDNNFSLTAFTQFLAFTI